MFVTHQCSNGGLASFFILSINVSALITSHIKNNKITITVASIFIVVIASVCINITNGITLMIVLMMINGMTVRLLLTTFTTNIITFTTNPIININFGFASTTPNAYKINHANNQYDRIKSIRIT